MALVRPIEHRVVAGVCAALANRFDVSVVLVRVVFLVLIPLPPSAILIYLLLWVLIPSE